MFQVSRFLAAGVARAAVEATFAGSGPSSQRACFGHQLWISLNSLVFLRFPWAFLELLRLQVFILFRIVTSYILYFMDTVYSLDEREYIIGEFILNFSQILSMIF